MIICAFAGIGKTTAANRMRGVVDLESTPFEKDWETYIRVAEHMSDNGYVVLLSCHMPLRKIMTERLIPYQVVMPFLDQKEEYIKRYKNRGDTDDFIELLSVNWEYPFNQTLDEEDVVRLRTNISDFLEPLNRPKGQKGVE